MKEQFVYDPLISKRQQFLLATQLVKMILKIDDVSVPNYLLFLIVFLKSYRPQLSFSQHTGYYKSWPRFLIYVNSSRLYMALEMKYNILIDELASL